jgi:hypothetical protein
MFKYNHDGKKVLNMRNKRVAITSGNVEYHHIAQCHHNYLEGSLSETLIPWNISLNLDIKTREAQKTHCTFPVLTPHYLKVFILIFSLGKKKPLNLN